MQLKSLAIAFAVITASAAIACNRTGSTAATPVPVTTVHVVNEGIPEMNVYVREVSMAALIHLGVALGNVTTEMTIPDSIMARDSVPLKFLADPVGRVRTSVSSIIVVHRGDVVTLRIPAG